MEDSSLDWDNFEYCPPECMEYEEEVEKGSSGFGWVLSKGLSLGKMLAVTGVVVSSAPIVVPPLLVVSALGIASSVPFGFIYATSYTCTEKLMSKLLPLPETIDYDEGEEDLIGYKERLGDDGVFDKRRYYREELANENGEVVVAGEYPVEDLGEDWEISQKYDVVREDMNEVAAGDGIIVTGAVEDKVQLDDDAGGCSKELICDDDEVMQLTEDYCNELRAVEELREDVEELWKDAMIRGDSFGITEGDPSVVTDSGSAARDMSNKEDVISDQNVNIDMLLEEGSISADGIVAGIWASPAGRPEASRIEGPIVPVEIVEDFVIGGPSTTDGVVEVIMAEGPVSADGTPEAIGVECPMISDGIVEEFMVEGPSVTSGVVVEIMGQGPITPAGTPEESGIEGPVEIVEDFVVGGPSSTAGVVEVIMAEGPITADGTTEAIEVEGPIIPDEFVEVFVVEGPTTTSGVVVEIMDKGPITPAEIVEQSVVEGPTTTSGIMEEIMVEGPITSDATTEAIGVEIPITPVVMVEEVGVGTITPAGTPEALGAEGPITAARTPESISMEGSITPAGTVEELLVKGPAVPARTAEKLKGPSVPDGTVLSPALHGRIHDSGSKIKTAPAGLEDKTNTRLGRGSELQNEVADTSGQKEMGKSDLKDKPYPNFGRKDETNVLGSKEVGKSKKGQTKGKGKKRTPKTPEGPSTTAATLEAPGVEGPITPVGTPEAPGVEGPVTSAGTPEEIRVEGLINQVVTSEAIGEAFGAGGQITPDVIVEELAVKVPTVPAIPVGELRSPTVPVGTVLGPELHGGINDSRNKNEIAQAGLEDKTAVKLGRGSELHSDATETSSSQKEVVRSDLMDKPDTNLGGDEKHVHGSADESRKRHTNAKGKKKTSKTQKRVQGDISKAQEKDRMKHENASGKVSGEAFGSASRESKVIWDGDAVVEGPGLSPQVVGELKITEVKPVDKNQPGPSVKEGSKSRSDGDIKNIPEVGSILDGEMRVQGDISKVQEKDRMKHENASDKVSGEAFGSASRESKVIWDGDAVVEGPDLSPQVVGQLKITEVKPVDKNQPGPSVKDGNKSRSDGDIKNIPKVGSIFDGEIKEKNKNAESQVQVLEVSAPAPVHVLKQHDQSSESKGNSSAHEADSRHHHDKDVPRDDEIWKQIDSIRLIVGFKLPRHTSYFEELKALYLFTGIEPPSMFSDPSDMPEFCHKLRFLMSVIGVK